MERGVKLSKNVAKQLAEHFNVSVEKLFKLEGGGERKH